MFTETVDLATKEGKEKVLEQLSQGLINSPELTCRVLDYCRALSILALELKDPVCYAVANLAVLKCSEIYHNHQRESEDSL